MAPLRLRDAFEVNDAFLGATVHQEEPRARCTSERGRYRDVPQKRVEDFVGWVVFGTYLHFREIGVVCDIWLHASSAGLYQLVAEKKRD